MDSNTIKENKIKLNNIEELKSYILNAISDIFNAKIYDNTIEFNKFSKFVIEICD